MEYLSVDKQQCSYFSRTLGNWETHRGDELRDEIHGWSFSVSGRGQVMFQLGLSTMSRPRSEYLDRAACSSSSFLASCAFRSAICAWSSAICSCRSFASPSSFLLTLSSSCLLFSSFFSRTEKEGLWSLDCSSARSP